MLGARMAFGARFGIPIHGFSFVGLDSQAILKADPYLKLSFRITVLSCSQQAVGVFYLARQQRRYCQENYNG
jgi:hypothetical protein